MQNVQISFSFPNIISRLYSNKFFFAEEIFKKKKTKIVLPPNDSGFHIEIHQNLRILRRHSLLGQVAKYHSLNFLLSSPIKDSSDILSLYVTCTNPHPKKKKIWIIKTHNPGFYLSPSSTIWELNSKAARSEVSRFRCRIGYINEKGPAHNINKY